MCSRFRNFARIYLVDGTAIYEELVDELVELSWNSNHKGKFTIPIEELYK
jgi:hypothetical protein